MELLKLAALDADDLAIVSAHLQDALVRVGDLTYLPGEHRFAMVARRFEWETGTDEPRRRLAGLHFERVLAARTRGIDRSRPDEPLNLLAITFEEKDAPSGSATFLFAGGACLQLDIECLEAFLKDLGPIRPADGRPPLEAEKA